MWSLVITLVVNWPPVQDRANTYTVRVAPVHLSELSVGDAYWVYLNLPHL